MDYKGWSGELPKESRRKRERPPIKRVYEDGDIADDEMPTTRNRYASPEHGYATPDDEMPTTRNRYASPDDGYETDDSEKTVETIIDETYISPTKTRKSIYQKYLEQIAKKYNVPLDYETSDTEIDGGKRKSRKQKQTKKNGKTNKKKDAKKSTKTKNKNKNKRKATKKTRTLRKRRS